MKKEAIFSATLSLLVMTALAASSSQNDITVQPGPVKVTEGNNVSLWCGFTDDSQDEIPVHWQSPPKFKTRTSNCQTFGSSSAKRKYVISCAENNTRWYNMTIADVQWVDRGKYRCIHTRYKEVVEVLVSVPVTEVSLTYVSNSTAEPLFLSNGMKALLTCKTNCAHPAPSISWFENDELTNGSASNNNTESSCAGEKEGQKRTISTITVAGKYVAKERKESKIICVAGNIGERTVSTAMDIIYGVTPSPTRAVMSLGLGGILAIAAVLGFAFIGTIVFITLFKVLTKHKTREDAVTIIEYNKHPSGDETTEMKNNTYSASTGSQSNTKEVAEMNANETVSKQHSQHSADEMNKENEDSFSASTGSQCDTKEVPVKKTESGDSTKASIGDSVKSNSSSSSRTRLLPLTNRYVPKGTQGCEDPVIECTGDDGWI